VFKSPVWRLIATKQDPKQRRFFHSKHIKELFQLDVPKDGKAESNEIFSELSAQVLPTDAASSASSSAKADELARSDSEYNSDSGSDSNDSAKDDAHILRELFASNGINSALWYAHLSAGEHVSLSLSYKRALAL